MTMTLTTWDSAAHLDSEEYMQVYLEAALAEGDAATIAMALGNIAKSRGMTQLAKETGLGRESLYKSLSGDVSPTLETILKVAKALGLKMTFQAA